MPAPEPLHRAPSDRSNTKERERRHPARWSAGTFSGALPHHRVMTATGSTFISPVYGPRWRIMNELAPPIADSLNSRFNSLRHKCFSRNVIGNCKTRAKWLAAKGWTRAGAAISRYSDFLYRRIPSFASLQGLIPERQWPCSAVTRLRLRTSTSAASR